MFVIDQFLIYLHLNMFGIKNFHSFVVAATRHVFSLADVLIVRRNFWIYFLIFKSGSLIRKLHNNYK